MYLAATNRKPNAEWLKQARVLFSRWNRKNLGLRGRKSYSGASGSQTALPPDLGRPSRWLWPRWCSLARTLPWDESVVSAGKRAENKNGFLFKILPFYVTNNSLSWNFHLYFFGHSLLQGFWERKRLHFQLLIEGGKDEGNPNGSSDPTHSFPTRGKAEVIVTETPGCAWCESLPVSETLTCIDNSWKSRLFGSVYVGGISSWLSSGINLISKEKTPLIMESGSCVFTPIKERT